MLSSTGHIAFKYPKIFRVFVNEDFKLQKKLFSPIFQSYFHNKYSLSDFYTTIPIKDYNFKLNTYKKHKTMSYVLTNSESIKLKNYHTFLNNAIFRHLRTSEVVYSYKQNHNILQMLTKHKDSKYYFVSDISNFFPSIGRNLIISCIKENLLNIPIDLSDKMLIETIANIVTYDGFLPAGFVASPSVSNAILYNFDKEMQKYCMKNDIIYTRYSDDLIFSSNKKLEAMPITVEQYLKNIYADTFKLNTTKSKYLDKTKRVQILGLVITPDNHITVPKQRKIKIKKLFHFYLNDKEKFIDYIKSHYNNSLAKAYGELNYINDIDKSFVSYLRKKYGNFIVDKFLHGNKNDK